ncbi:hypothetical protein ANN_05392 [Periplaneta americana]|uniref:DUF4817 domain-containing protein n=1 Tax=Periplaneta americana TaxID=6978 RepID=A0ABQ8TD43_PERAM|nr:hypothetical protein ANN_05392 [Periplaneta americana]
MVVKLGLTLREQKLRVFENRVLRKIFEAKRDEVAGEWRKLHNGKLVADLESEVAMQLAPHDQSNGLLFSTFCINLKMQYTLNQRLFLVKQYWITNSITATQRAYQREFGVRNPPKRNIILGLVNKLETTGSLAGSPLYVLKWEDNIKKDLREVGYDDRDWINLAQDRDRWQAHMRAAMSQSWRVAANILNKQSRTADKGWSSSLGVGRRAKTRHRKKQLVTKPNNKPRNGTDSPARPQQSVSWEAGGKKTFGDAET